MVDLYGLDKFRQPKTIFCSIFIVLLVFLFLIPRRLRVRFQPRSWEFLLGFTFLYAGIQGLIGSYPEIAHSAWLQLSFFLALLLLMREIASESLQKKAWVVSAVALAINAFLTILQYFGWFPLLLTTDQEVLRGRANAAGLIGEVNSGGFLFGLVSLLLLYGVVVPHKRSVKVSCGVLLGANLTGLLFTQTVTALAALSICLFLWLIFHHWWVIANRKNPWRSLLTVWLLLAIALVGISVVVVQSGIKDRLQLIWTQVRQGDWSTATAGRQPVYRITWEMIKERPWTGNGLNTFGPDFFQYRTSTALGRAQELVNEPGSYRETHNDYLQTWEELGLVGFLLFLGLWGWVPIRALTELPRLEPERAYGVAMLVLGVVYVSIDSLGFFLLRLAVTGSYVVLLFAGLRHFQNLERLPLETEARESWIGKTGKVVALAGLATLCVALQLRSWVANQKLGSAAVLLERAVAEPSNSRRQRAFAEAAATRLVRAGQLCSKCYETHNFSGSAALMLGRYEEAIAHYQKAARYLPSPEVLTNLATAYMQREQYHQARAHIETALHYNPHYVQARRALDHLENNSR